MRVAGYKNEGSFYASKPWRQIRASKLNENPLCELCIKKEQLTEAYEVDHIRPLKQSPWLALVWVNLQSLCKVCHSAKTAGETNEKKGRKRNGKILNKVWKV